MPDDPTSRPRAARAARRLRRGHQAERPVLLVSVPKAGSSLLRALTLALPGTRWAGHAEGVRELGREEDRLARLAARLTSPGPGAVYAAHLPYSPAAARWLDAQRIATVFLYRDPRDYVISWVHQVERHQPAPPPYRAFADLPPSEDRLMATIRGLGRGRDGHVLSETDYPGVRWTYEAYLGWLEQQGTLSLKFEELVAQRDGRPAEPARRAIARLARHLGIGPVGPDDPLVERVLVEGLDPDRSFTFRDGRTGGWREAFSDAHRAEFERLAGRLAERLGYPPTFEAEESTR